MHCRPVIIGAQTQEELEYLLIGKRTHYATFVARLHCRGTPRHKTPVFVVDEYTAVVYIGSLAVGVAGGQFKAVETARCGVGPPFPWRYTHQTRQFEHTVGKAVAVGSGYQ